MMRRFRKHKTTSTAVERQSSVEYLDTIAYQEEIEQRTSSTPNLSAEQIVKKEKRRRHFHVFHKKHHHHHKERRSELDNNLTETLPAGTTHIRPPGEHLSLGSTWGHSNWTTMDQQHRNSSLQSSNTSLLSAESEGRELLSEEELVKSLVNPARKESFRASVTPVSLPCC